MAEALRGRASDRAPVPMFPLGSVLFPTMPLVLHVFEPRYRALARQCVNGDRRLGVVLIERGSEVGGGDVRCGVATLAEIVEAVEFDDGRWGLGLMGRQRITVTQWLPDGPYPRAEVELLDDTADVRSPVGALTTLEGVLRRVLAMRAELGESAPPATVEIAADPVLATWQAAVLGGIGPADAQKVLETDDPARRLDLVTALLVDEADVLALRVAGG